MQTEKHDRFFVGLLVGVVALAAVAVGIALWRQKHATYRTDDTPSAAVYNYLMAVGRGDWDMAYDTLGDIRCKPDRGEFEAVLAAESSFPDVLIVQEKQSGERAWVTLRFRYSGGGWYPDDLYYDGDQVRLRHTTAGWKIEALPPQIWPFAWRYDGTCKDETSGGD